ncbi:Transcriptional regulatory protein RstA [hydrothermal vent metagenome]|uniref:Transcriptional regulatory protein RstA n=1 Tax=hydrothermal vent metagenome TaxID=652676 RepID=A0A3B1AU16_9ZZZZ
MEYLADTTTPLVLNLKHIERCIEERDLSNGLDIVRNLIRGTSNMIKNSTKITNTRALGRDEVNFGGLCIKRKYAQVTLDERAIELTNNEYSLLMLLVDNHDQIVSRDTLHQRILNTEYDGLNRAIDNTVSRIRKKLGDNSLSQLKIKSIRGRGYLFSSAEW